MQKIIIIAMVVLLALACQDEQYTVDKSSSDLVIKTGTICGWCTINDTLSIIGNSVRYVNYKGCNNAQPAVKKSRDIEDSELDTLLSKLDFNEFKKIELHTSNIAFDGCDTWLFVDNGSESHYIRYTGNEPVLQPIRGFIDQLNAVKANYQ